MTEPDREHTNRWQNMEPDDRKIAIEIALLIVGGAVIGLLIPRVILHLHGTPHEPISIIEEEDLDAYDFPGDGTPTDPYIIEGLSIAGDDCIRIGISAHFVIRDCYIHARRSGIWFSGTSCSISGCTLVGHQGGDAIIGGMGDMTVIDTDISGFVMGILRVDEICDSQYTFTGNRIKDCIHGIHLAKADDTICTENTITDCKVGVYIDDMTVQSFSGNIIRGCSSHGIEIHRWKNNRPGRLKLITNTITACGGNGVHVHYSEGVTLSNNTIGSNTGHGVYFNRSSDCVVEYNAITNNGGYGVHAEDSSAIQLADNEFENNDLGSSSL